MSDNSAEYTKMIAETIQEQLEGTLGKPVLWSWGQDNLQAVSINGLKRIGIDGSGGLLFSVNGALHKGEVLVSPNGSDTYDVFIGRKPSVEGEHFATIVKAKGLYFDKIGEWIDAQVELTSNLTEKKEK